MTTIHQRLSALRKAMLTHHIDAYLITGGDPHQSEYVADHWKTREWISGFTGSAGKVIITQHKAVLWTDSRYYLQAEIELKDTEFVMQPLLLNGKAQYANWLLEQLPSGASLGLDAYLWTSSQLQQLKQTLLPKGIELKTDIDLITDCWSSRPPLPEQTIFEHAEKYAGASRRQKIQEIRQLLLTREADAYLISTLDDIAWLLNLRGNDIDFNPVFMAYLWLSIDNCILFIQPDKVPAPLKTQLAADNIDLLPYQNIESWLQQLPVNHPNTYVEATLNYALRKRLNPERTQTGAALVQAKKALKNATEVTHLREVMRKDGVALVKFYRWLETQLPSGQLTEYACVEQLAYFRSQQAHYFGESFAAIVGYQANGAIVHYRPSTTQSALLQPAGLLLIDSGGQYLDGTTDITRTISLGAPAPDEQAAFTKVLKGHIALASIHFPKGTTGGQLDVLARMYLWKSGLNYGHGTGHGVGFFLNVHEGPQRISPLADTSGRIPIQPGMLTSNEPGYYQNGHFGIRTENLMLCVESEHSQAETPFYTFETLTLFPIDQRLIDFSLLETAEIDWLNHYHQQVYQGLSDQLNEAERHWLAQKCQVIEKN